MLVRIIITKAILDPLTTNICVIPALVNDFFVSFVRSSIFPIVIPSIIPAIFSGNPLNKTDFAHFCTSQRVFIGAICILLKIGTTLFP
jgi:hypothetical protein